MGFGGIGTYDFVRGGSHNADDPLSLYIRCPRSILWLVTLCGINLILTKNVEEHCAMRILVVGLEKTSAARSV